MKRLHKIFTLILTLFLSVTVLAGCTVKASPEKYEESRSLMDTFFKVTVYSEDKTLAGKAINAAYERMEEITRVASIFDEGAEAYRLNRDGYLDNPSPDLVQLIRLSIEVNRLTHGAFDITVQPLLDIWKAGLWKESLEIQQTKVNEIMKLIGCDKIEITSNRINLKEPGMKITLGALAKGYAVDEAREALEKMGIKHALIAAGGDIGSLGTKPSGEPWRIGLTNPDNTEESLATFQFAQKSVSTSGNYERYFSPDKKVNHIMNPKTGYSAAECISVTVIAANNTRADALATSVFVLGPVEGLRLVESLDDVECLIVDNARKIHLSSGMDKYLIESK